MKAALVQYALTRFLALLVSLFLIASLLFVIFWMPNDGTHLIPRGGGEEFRQAVIDDLKLDEPLYVQYLNTLYRLFTFDFFMSSAVRPYADVSDMVWDAAPWTIMVFVASAVFSSMIGLGLAWIANTSKSRYPAIFIKGACAICFCLPLLPLTMYLFLHGQWVDYEDELWRAWNALLTLVAVVIIATGMFALANMKPIRGSRETQPQGGPRRSSVTFSPTMLSFFLVFTMAYVLISDLLVGYDGLGALLWTGIWSMDYQVIISCTYVVFFILAISLFSVDAVWAAWHPMRGGHGIASEQEPSLAAVPIENPSLISTTPSARSTNWCASLVSEYRRHTVGVLALVGIAVIALVTLLASVLSTVPEPWEMQNYEPNDYQSGAFNPMPPSWERSPITGFLHPLGTDNVGQDVYSLLLYGARFPLCVALGTAALSLALGLLALICNAYFSHRRDILSKVPTSISMVLSETFLALPILVSLAVLSVGVLLAFDSKASVVLVSIIWVSLFAWAPIWKELRSRETPSADAALLSAEGRPFGEVVKENVSTHMWLVVRYSKFITVTVYASYFMLFTYRIFEWRMYSWSTMLERAWEWNAFFQDSWWMYVPVSLCIMVLGLCMYAALSTLETVVRPRGLRT